MTMNDEQSWKRDLHGFIDRPKRRQSLSRPAKILLLVVILAAILFGGQTALSYWVDLLWFRSLGYGDVFWTTWRLRCETFTIFAIATFLILYGAFLALKHAHQADLPSDHEIVIAGQPVNLSVEPALRIVALCAALLIAGVTGTTMMGEWPTLALFWYASPNAGGVADPIFGKPIGFFLFTLPAWHLIVDWLLTLSVITTAIAVLFLLITSGARALDKRRISYGPSPWRGLSITSSFLLLLLAINLYVGRFDRLLERHTIFEGVTYNDAHVVLTGLLIVSAALVLGAAIAAVNAFRQARGKWLVAAIIPAALCYLALGVVGWYVGNFVVKPNELVREQPYIAHNIEMTRQAYGLDRFLQREFPAETSVEATEPAKNQATLQNIRLWDWRALQDTLRQVQEIRTYYDFPDIDIDRYELDGTLRQVMLATRELNVENSPRAVATGSTRSWSTPTATESP
jgi:hypothetical protein